MVKKICITGSHGLGKTTLSFILAAHYKKQGKSVKVVQEVARQSPFPLNENMSKEACLWIYHEHMRKEIEACRGNDIVICDRSAIDSFIYANVKKCFDDNDRSFVNSFSSSLYHMDSYDSIIHIIPSDNEIKDDGFRSVDKIFQTKVANQFFIFFNEVLEHLINEGKLKIISSSEVFFDENTLLEKLCLF